MKRTKLRDRTLPDYTLGEEIFNYVTHIVGAALGAAYLTLAVIIAAFHGNVWGVVGSSIYGASVTVLFTISAVYHALHPSTAKKVLQVLDHCTIFFMIAGSYTPIAFCTVRGVSRALGWVVFGIIWATAVLGIVLNAIDLEKYQLFSMFSYVGMGWCIVLTAPWVFGRLGLFGTVFLVGGGILYSIGAVFFVLGKNKRFAHSVFHIFVVLGSVAHFFCIAFFVV